MSQLIGGVSVRKIAILSTSLLLAACHHSEPVQLRAVPPAEQLVHVSDIVNAVKCELAQTFAGNAYSDLVGREEDDGEDIGASLEFSRAYTQEDTGTFGVSIPIGLEIEGGGSRGIESSEEFELSFTYDLDDNIVVPAFCEELDRTVRVNGSPFVEVLDAIQTEYGQLEAGPPLVQLGEISYTSAFEVQRTSNGGGTLTLLIFEVGGERSRGQSAAQSLTIDFNLVVSAAMR